MFIPLHDTNPLKKIRFQYVTVGLIALNVAIYAIEKVQQLGGKVVACSDSSGLVHDEQGIDLDLLALPVLNPLAIGIDDPDKRERVGEDKITRFRGA